MRRSFTTLVAVVAVATLGFTPAPTPLLTDEAGDGNAINGQGLDGITGLNPTQNTAPANASMDLVALSAATIFDVDDTGEAPVYTTAGLQWRLATTSAPSAADVPTITRIVTSIEGCATWFQFYAGTNGKDAHGSANLRILGGCGLGTNAAGLSVSKTLPGDAITVSYDEATGETVFDVDLAALPAELAAYLGDGALINPEYVEVRVNTGVVTAPVVDRMVNSDFNEFTVGQDVPSDE